MRFLINADIIEKRLPNKSNYNYEIYSMIMNNVSPNISKEFHKKNKSFRLITYSNAHIKEDKVHFYIAARDDIAECLIKYLSANLIVRLGDMVIKITKILPMENLKKREKYLFKTSLIVNVSKENKCVLSDEFDYIEKRLKNIAISKAQKCGIDKKCIEFEIINPTHKINKYKDGHVNSWKCFLKVVGDYELINFLYSISGVGENTATGHGLLWEVI
ncbi:hypothetical protein UT300005_19530 [Clostridium sp. CTA-5]